MYCVLSWFSLSIWLQELLERLAQENQQIAMLEAQLQVGQSVIAAILFSIHL